MYISVSFVTDTYKQHFAANLFKPVITATRRTWCIIIFLTCQIFCGIFSVKIVYSFYISNKKLLKFLSISVFLWNVGCIRSKKWVSMDEDGAI